MDAKPDELREQIGRTRARLDRHLDRLGAQVDATRERMKIAAQWWAGVGAVAAGAIGAVWFWPHKGRSRARRMPSLPTGVRT
jgi:hypothetical protein